MRDTQHYWPGDKLILCLNYLTSCSRCRREFHQKQQLGYLEPSNPEGFTSPMKTYCEECGVTVECLAGLISPMYWIEMRKLLHAS